VRPTQNRKRKSPLFPLPYSRALTTRQASAPSSRRATAVVVSRPAPESQPVHSHFDPFKMGNKLGSASRPQPKAPLSAAEALRGGSSVGRPSVMCWHSCSDRQAMHTKTCGLPAVNTIRHSRSAQGCRNVRLVATTGPLNTRHHTKFYRLSESRRRFHLKSVANVAVAIDVPAGLPSKSFEYRHCKETPPVSPVGTSPTAQDGSHQHAPGGGREFAGHLRGGVHR